MLAAKKTAADQECINAMLTVQLADATEKLTGYDSLREKEDVLKKKLADMERSIEDHKKASENELRQAQVQNDLAIERAVMAKERELFEQIRQSDRENAKLLARIEQLEHQLKEQKTPE